jgi:hypothetical protein
MAGFKEISMENFVPVFFRYVESVDRDNIRNFKPISNKTTANFTII